MRGSEQQQQPKEGVSWADATSGNGHKRGNQCCEQLRAVNEMMTRKLEEMEKKLRNMQALLQQQQQQQRHHQGEELQENKADQTSAPQTQQLQQQKQPAQQKQVQQRQQQEKQKQQEEQPKNDTEMEIAKDEDEDDETPKKRARLSTKKNYDSQIEKLTTTVGNLTTTVKNLATATEQRFARLEEMLSTLTASHRNLCERFEIVEQTQKVMIRNPIFAAQFTSHPYIQEQVQQPTMQ